MCYINTNSFAYADFISRLISTHDRPDEDVIIGSVVNNVECFALDTAKMLPITYETIQDEKKRNDSLKQVADYIESP